MNRLTTLTSSLTGQFGFSYDALNRRTQLTRPNGVDTNYSYDSVSRLLSVLHQAGSTLDGASYSYDYAGNRTSKTNYLNSITEGYTYDLIYQLVQVAQGGSTTENYSYDPVGNRLSSLGVPSYNYNSSNELTSTSNGSYTYDANGNTLSDAQGRSFTWDYENRLTQAVVPGQNGGTTTFRYDPFGRRIQKSGPLGTKNYLYDGANLVEEVDGSGNVLALYTQGSEFDEELSQLRAGTSSYYDADGLGSITSLTSGTGALANTYSYDSYGKLLASTGTISNPFQYTGRELDSETGLSYNRNRYYDQDVGRFASEDPLRFEAGADFYSYVENNPVNFIDPFGLQSGAPAPAPIKPQPQPTPKPPVGPEPWGPLAFCAANPAICVAVLYLASPGLAGDPYEEQKCRRQGRWHCTAKCHINNFSHLPNIPDFVTGEGWGNSIAEAQLAAEKGANTRVPRGTYKRHCSFKCEQR